MAVWVVIFGGEFAGMFAARAGPFRQQELAGAAASRHEVSGKHCGPGVVRW